MLNRNKNTTSKVLHILVWFLFFFFLHILFLLWQIFTIFYITAQFRIQSETNKKACAETQREAYHKKKIKQLTNTTSFYSQKNLLVFSIYIFHMWAIWKSFFFFSVLLFWWCYYYDYYTLFLFICDWLCEYDGVSSGCNASFCSYTHVLFFLIFLNRE